MQCFAIVCMSLVSVSCGGLAPVYSPSYANVRQQGASKHESGIAYRDTTEEVTDPPQSSTDGEISLKGCDDVNPTISTDTATEPDSEIVNVTQIYNNRIPKKLNEPLELLEELDPTEQPDLKPTDAPVLEEQGVYYIYHPSGLLQRVFFATRDDHGSMEYQANFNYQDVEPIVEPIYTYDSSTLLFQRLQLV